MATQNTATLPSTFGNTGFVSTTGPDGSGGVATQQFGIGLTGASGGGPTVFHAGGVSAGVAAFGTDTTPVNTECYISEVFIPCFATLTGIALMNGSAAAGNVQISLADNSGVPIAAALTASTAQTGTNVYQLIPFATKYNAAGPTRLFVMVQFDTNSTPRYRSHIAGAFNTQKQTAGTYGTFVAITIANTFTTNVGPVCSTY
jgi:hypothetical protein